jgi:hypothetical protein
MVSARITETAVSTRSAPEQKTPFHQYNETMVLFYQYPPLFQGQKKRHEFSQ